MGSLRFRGTPGKVRVRAVGERMHGSISGCGLALPGSFPVPGALREIASLVGQILTRSDAHGVLGRAGAVPERHLFYNRPTSFFRASAESLASESASRLAAVDHADRNIEQMLVKLQADFHRLRQRAIDSELSDVVAGFMALRGDAT